MEVNLDFEKKDERSELEKFCEKLVDRVSLYYGNGYQVSISEVRKNNGTVKHAIIIREDGSNIAPSIYIDRLFEEYLSGTSFCTVIKKVIDIRNDNAVMPEFNIEYVNDYELVRGRLGIKLINYDLNREMLESIPYKRFLDLAVVFFISVEEVEGGEAVILINNNLYHSWNISEEDLYNDALTNACIKYPDSLMSMNTLLKEMMLEKLNDDRLNNKEIDIERINSVLDKLEEGIEEVYVLSNRQRWYGAACMIYPGLLDKIGRDFGRDYYILPSSVHELILYISMDDEPENEENEHRLSTMVREVNTYELNGDEVLADHVYKYDCENKNLIIID